MNVTKPVGLWEMVWAQRGKLSLFLPDWGIAIPMARRDHAHFWTWIWKYQKSCAKVLRNVVKLKAGLPSTVLLARILSLYLSLSWWCCLQSTDSVWSGMDVMVLWTLATCLLEQKITQQRCWTLKLYEIIPVNCLVAKVFQIRIFWIKG